MSLHDSAIAILLFIGVGIQLVCAVGVLVMGNVYDKLHFLGPASMVAPVAIAAAVVIEELLSANGVKAIFVAILLLLSNPVLTHATARAARVREHGHWQSLEEELVDER